MRHMRDAEAKSQQALFDEESIYWLDFGKRKEIVCGEGHGLGHILSCAPFISCVANHYSSWSLQYVVQ